MVMQNAWNLHRKLKSDDNPYHDLLSFRREVVNTYLSKFDHSQDVHVAVFYLQKDVQTQICNLIESNIFRASWRHKNAVVSVVKTHVKGVQNVVLVFMIIVIGRAKRAPHWGVQSRFRVIYV